MKNDIIDDILKVEAEAKKVVEDAKMTSNDLLYTAQMNANKLIKSRLEIRRNENAEILNSIIKENSDILKAYEKELEDEDKNYGVSEEKLQNAAKAIVDTICEVALKE